MKGFSCKLVLLLLIVLVFGLLGCATTQTMPSVATPEHPKIYSGARLDFYAISHNEEALKKFNAKPPEHPLIDFPFSVILDTIILPITYPVASYELLFGL
jgi:uncharacterized protein YceK